MKYIEQPPNFGLINKKKLNIEKMTICPHAIRTIEDWAQKKISNCWAPIGTKGLAKKAPTGKQSPRIK